MPKRLAITISGAVSLGSYEAGVLYEITRAIGQHNQDVNTTPDQKIYIDVLTGASAGGMTATIAAQKLMYEAAALNGTYTNAFYLPWVADIGLDGLLAMHGDDDAKKSILSSDTVIDISCRYLTQRYLSHVDTVPAKHPAAADKLWLGLALSNLNGVDYSMPVRPSGKFIYTRHQDQLSTWFDAANPADDTLDFWEPLRNAAVSCGAFPFAFRVIDVIRHASEYPSPNLNTPIAPNQTFSYTDGGVFQNEPLGLAKNLVDQIDNHLDVENRFYLFVAPHAKSSSANSDFNASKADFRETAMRLTAAIYDQAQFQDWITAEKLNDRVAAYNAQAAALHSALMSGAVNPAQLQPTSAALLPLLFSTTPAGSQVTETNRVRSQFAKEYQSLSAAKGQPAADVFIDAILTFETAAQLGDRDEMTIYGITVENSELASFELCSFAGFFDKSYRDHDYEVGRSKAQQFLANPGALGPIHYQPEPLGQIDPNLNGLTLDKMTAATRETVRDRLRDRAKEIMKEFGIDPWLIGGAVRDAIDLAIVKPQLNKLLKL